MQAAHNGGAFSSASGLRNAGNLGLRGCDVRMLGYASHLLLNVQFIIGVIVTIALVSVIIIASLIGTFIPLLLDKFGIDPALATGPFITTSNDICGILIYFSIAKLILGF